MKNLTIILLICVFINIFSSCKKSDPQSSTTGTTGTTGSTGTTTNPVNTAPVITSLSVSSGAYNAQVVITGSNFSSTITGNSVFFNGVAAKILGGTTTQLTVTVPLGAGTGPVSITVNNVTATGPVFTYQQTLVVSGFIGYANNGTGIFSGPGASVYLFRTTSLAMALDASNDIYISWGSFLSPLIMLKSTPAGNVSVYAGNDLGNVGSFANYALNRFYYPAYMAIDATGNIYGSGGDNYIEVTTSTSTTVLASFSTSVVTSPPRFSSVAGMVLDPTTGNLYVTDPSDLIWKVTPSGVATIFAGTGKTGSADGAALSASFSTPDAIVMDGSGNLYVQDYANKSIRKITLAGVVSTLASSLPSCEGIAVDATGNVYFSDETNHVIKKVTSAGVISTYAGNGTAAVNDGAALSASFQTPTNLVMDKNNNLYVLDNYIIRKISVQ